MSFSQTVVVCMANKIAPPRSGYNKQVYQIHCGRHRPRLFDLSLHSFHLILLYAIGFREK